MEPTAPIVASSASSSTSVVIPKYVFIVPYRDREPHRVFFSTYIYKIMADVPPEDWTYFFIHQTDRRPFNRGGMKNIGFLALKHKYPHDYKNIIFIFNDIDTLPYDKNILPYHTDFGVIKHFYGFEFALGGIFSIRGIDFERINGFPNFWAWGGEDNLIHQRAKDFGLVIDRTVFYSIGNNNILQFADGIKRIICRDELATSLIPNHIDGISKITNLTFNIYDDTHMIDVLTFETYISHTQLRFEEDTLDKLTKIRVSPSNAIRNIKQLQDTHKLEMYDTIQSTHKNIPPLNTNNQFQMNFMGNRPPPPQQHPMQQHPTQQQQQQRPVLNTGGLHGHNRFGMRGLFM